MFRLSCSDGGAFSVHRVGGSSELIKVDEANLDFEEKKKTNCEFFTLLKSRFHMNSFCGCEKCVEYERALTKRFIVDFILSQVI